MLSGRRLERPPAQQVAAARAAARPGAAGDRDAFIVYAFVAPYCPWAVKVSRPRGSPSPKVPFSPCGSAKTSFKVFAVVPSSNSGAPLREIVLIFGSALAVPAAPFRAATVIGPILPAYGGAGSMSASG